MQPAILLRAEMRRKTGCVHRSSFCCANILEILGGFTENQ